MEAKAIAHPSGLPRVVLVCSASPVDCGHASMMSARPTHADIGKAAAQSLSQTDDIGRDVQMLAREKLSRAIESCVDFIENQEHLLVIANVP